MTIKEGTGMRPSTSTSAPLSKTENKAVLSTTPTIPASSAGTRPFPVSNNNLTNGGATSSDQVKAVLDTLGVKLIKSEAERDTLKKLVEETRATQQRLERELLENRKELAETRRKIDEQSTETEQSKSRHERLDEKLREAQANTLKLSRKMEADEQRRNRMQRRMQRLETIASEAQSALQSRAMVLLTDQTLAQQSGLPVLPAAGGALSVPSAGYIGSVAASSPAIDLDGPWWKQPVRLNTSVAVLAVFVALGFGWLASTSVQNNAQTAVAVMADGSLARINLKTGTLEPLKLSLKKLDDAQSATPASVSAPEAVSPALAPKSKAVAFDEKQVVGPASAPARDETLSAGLKELQDKAYAGVAEAQHDLAALYTAGSGVKQDYARASYWFHQAAAAGVANAAYNLGVLHHQGLGLDKNIVTALDWYRQAALQGHPEAQYNLGIAYIEGIGTKYNPQLAAGFFQKAALSGITEAAYNLGLILENGLLSEPKPLQAMVWYRVGSESGSMEARNALEQIATRMNVPFEKAGVLPDGTSLSKLIVKPENGQPALDATTAVTLQKIMPELTEMIPDDNQLLVAQIQEQLARRQVYDGAEDGALSQKTTDAIKDYQKDQKFDVDGKPSVDLLSRLLAQSTILSKK
jgi:TPR repeat protein